MLRVGILGGTFDPVHAGHLAMARTAERACKLDRVYFVPAPQPWHRDPPQAGYADRYAMLALALQGHPRWLPLAVPDRPGRPTYAVDQLAWLERRLRRGGESAAFFYILGADSFATLPTWRAYRRLLGRCEFVVLARAGWNKRDVLRRLPPRLVAPRCLHWLEDFASPASATAVRSAVRSGAPSRQVPAPVRRYLQRAQLYHYGNTH